MKKIGLFVVFFLWGYFSLHNLFAQEKLGLLIIAHGSPDKQWNQKIFDLESELQTLFKSKNINDFNTIKVALMEFSEPSVSTVVKEMKNQGVTKIYAIPLFIAPSEHTVYDLPTLLGLYFDETKYNELKEENIKIVNDDIKIVIGPTLNYKSVIKNILLEKIKEISKNPKEEALILLTHGSKKFLPLWESLMQPTVQYILANTGIEYFQNVFIGVGQNSNEAIQAILRAANNKKTVIVAGLYISLDVEEIIKKSKIPFPDGKVIEATKLLEGKNIVFVKGGLLPNKKINEWIVQRASEWLKM